MKKRPLMSCFLRLTTLVALVVLAACRQPGTGTAESPDAQQLVLQAQERVDALTSYVAPITLTVKYQDGTEKTVHNQNAVVLKLVSPGAPGGSFSCADPLAFRLPPGAAFNSPQTVCFRQPGDWTGLRPALGYLATASDLHQVDQQVVDGKVVVHLRATFAQRPDLDKFRPIMMDSVKHDEPLLMKDIYGGASQTVDVWIGKEDLLPRRIDVVTAELNYPSGMPEPNDLYGAVQERDMILFQDFDVPGAGLFFPVSRPTDLVAKPLASRPAIQLSWVAPGDGATSVVVQRSSVSADGPWNQIALLTATKTTYVDEDVTAGQTYFYRLSASGQSRTSNYSDVVSAVPCCTEG